MAKIKPRRHVFNKKIKAALHVAFCQGWNEHSDKFGTLDWRDTPGYMYACFEEMFPDVSRPLIAVVNRLLKRYENVILKYSAHDVGCSSWQLAESNCNCGLTETLAAIESGKYLE